jgi:hypothetical protein
LNDLELLRAVFRDERLHFGVGAIQQLGLASDGSALRVLVNMLPENRVVVAQMTFADLAMVTFPEVDDLCLVAFGDGHPDEAWVLKVANTNDEPIPTFAMTGNTMISPRSGLQVGIGRSTAVPTEPLVLGDTLTAGLTYLCNAFLNAEQIGWNAVGAVYLDPDLRLAIINFKTIYLNTAATNIVSQIALTERGV